MSNNPRSGQHMPRQHDDIGPKPMTAPRMTRGQALAAAVDQHGDSASIFCYKGAYWLGCRDDSGDVRWVKGTSYRDVLKKAADADRRAE